MDGTEATHLDINFFDIDFCDLITLNSNIRRITDSSLSAIGISRHSALILEILENRKAAMTNKEIQQAFLQFNWYLATQVGVNVSRAKGELLQQGYIETQGKISVVAITQAGREACKRINDVSEQMIAELPEHERDALRRFSTMILTPQNPSPNA
jgi:hypothetical protein